MSPIPGYDQNNNYRENFHNFLFICTESAAIVQAFIGKAFAIH